MDLNLLLQSSPFEWWIMKHGKMRVPGIIYGSRQLVEQMDMKVYEQVVNVASLSGIVKASFAMPDAHWGYGFPIGGVAAFDAEEGGVISAGGVGFDISCGVRLHHTGLQRQDIVAKQTLLADSLFIAIPAGVGSTGKIHLDMHGMDEVLRGGAKWTVEQGYGTSEDLERIEEHGQMSGAQPEEVSTQAKKRQLNEMGTLGSGNHYLEVQLVTQVFDNRVAAAFGLHEGDVVVSVHCGSRGLGHQIGTDFLRRMAIEAPEHGIVLADRELACAPIDSPTGQSYLGAMRAAINCALANRQIITHLLREVFRQIFPDQRLNLLYDVSHNTCKLEEHKVDGKRRRLFVHRKGATRAYGPEHPDLPSALRTSGQPVLIGGSMGTASYVLAGTSTGMSLAFGSSCHGAGRAMSRHQATKQWRGKQIVAELASRGILIRSPSYRGVAEEAPLAYKDIDAVVDAADAAGISRKVARLEPLICIKG